MFTRQKVGLLALALASVGFSGVAMAASADSTMTVSATLTSGCEVSATSSIGFGSLVALASTPDKTADSGETFSIACSASASPTISSSQTREMVNGESVLPFNLSLAAGAAANDLSADAGNGSTFPASFVQDGDLKVVTIHAKTLASNFKSLPTGAYTVNVTLAVAY